VSSLETETICINGILKVDDFVLSTIDSEYPCMVGQVKKIISARSSGNDDIVVDFRQDYSAARIKQIEETFSALMGIPKRIHECGLDKLIISPECLIRISDANMNLIPSFLEDEKYAVVFAYRTIRFQQYQQRNAPELRRVRGQHFEIKDGRSELIPFNIGWFHRWGSQIEETTSGSLESTVAIVEMPDGVVRTVYPNHMEFIVDDKQLS